MFEFLFVVDLSALKPNFCSKLDFYLPSPLPIFHPSNTHLQSASGKHAPINPISEKLPTHPQPPQPDAPTLPATLTRSPP